MIQILNDNRTPKLADCLDSHNLMLFKLHGLLGYMYPVLRSHFSDEDISVYKEGWKKQWLRSELFLQEAGRLQRVTNSKPLVFLKGIGLLRNIYKDHGQRFLSDIDILVNQKDKRFWCQNLESLGYRQKRETHWRANSFKSHFSKKVLGQEVTVELHERLFQKEPENWCWETTQLDKDFQVLANEDLIVHLCGHLGYQHSFLRLMWLVDIVHCLKDFSDHIDWNKVTHRAKSMRVHQSVSACLHLCKTHFACQIPDFMTNSVYRLTKRLLNEENLWQLPKRRWSYYLLKHSIKDSWLDSIEYDFFWLLYKLKSGRPPHPSLKPETRM